MTYRIRKDKSNRYIPEMRGFSTLFMWFHVPDIGGMYSMFNSGALKYYNSDSAKTVINRHKDFETKKEEIIRMNK